MGTLLDTWLQAAAVLVIVGVLHVPLGDYLARAFGPGPHWRAELLFYRCCGVDPEADQRWPDYLRSLLAVSGVGVLRSRSRWRSGSSWPASA